MTSIIRRTLALLLPLAVLATAGAASAVPVTAGGVTVDVVAVNSWNGGYNGAVRITNSSFSAGITAFQVVFKLGSSTISNSWNGTITGPDGSGNYTAVNPSWLQYGPIRTGSTWEVGFGGNGSFGGSTIVSVSLNGQTVYPGGPVDTTPPSVTLTSSAASVTAPQTITLSADATDANGLSGGVRFYDGAILLGTDSTSPYSWQISLTAANNGTHSYTAQATDPSGNVGTSAAVSVVVDIGTTSTFTMSAPASAAVTRGATATAAISLTRTNFTAAVALSASGLPSGVTASFSPASVTGTSSTLTFTASSTATLGTSSVTVTATGNGVTRTATISLTVNDGTTPTFTLAASPATLTVNRGGSGSSTITITRTSFTSAIAFTASGLPTGVTASFNPASATGNSAIVTLAASSSAAAGGPVTVTITGTSGSLTRTATIALTVGNTTTTGVFRVVDGKVTKDGQRFPVRCGSWFGLQGRYEPAYDSANPRGAPMEQYVGNTFWANNHSRTVMQTMNEIKAAGITVIRLPVVHQTLNPSDPQGNGSLYKNHSSIINDATYPMRNAKESMESMIKAANAVGIAVMLDIHSCSNYIDWRKGRLDARPPWVDATRDDYDYKREEWSCASTGNPSTVTHTQPYNETIWLEDLRTLAGLPQALGVSNIIGIDIFNEPWDYTWSEWKTLTEHAYQAINAVNPNLLLFVQGISGSAGNQDGTPTTITQTPHGDAASNPNWGENLFPAGDDLPNVPVEKLVWSPHTYGPSVAVQPMFMDPAQPECAGLEGDAAGDAKCQMVINPTLLRSGWEEHFGYLKDLGYAIVVGEFGGNMDWPLGQASTRDRNRYSYLTDKTVDAKWQNAFVDYMVSRGIEGCYWSINPESGDTGGWYGHAYDPISNTGGWGEWKPFDTRKTTLLNRLWNGVP